MRLVETVADGSDALGDACPDDELDEHVDCGTDFYPIVKVVIGRV